MRFIIFSLCMMALVSCGIENFDSTADLNPPLALKATSSNNEVQLSFSAYNNETAFGGYNIYIGTSPAIVQLKQYILKNYGGELPFIQDTPFNSVQTITLTVIKNTNGYIFTGDEVLYLGVTAYNVQTGVDSEPSNVVNIVVSN